MILFRRFQVKYRTATFETNVYEKTHLFGNLSTELKLKHVSTLPAKSNENTNFQKQPPQALSKSCF